MTNVESPFFLCQRMWKACKVTFFAGRDDTGIRDIKSLLKNSWILIARWASPWWSNDSNSKMCESNCCAKFTFDRRITCLYTETSISIALPICALHMYLYAHACACNSVQAAIRILAPDCCISRYFLSQYGHDFSDILSQSFLSEKPIHILFF